MYRPQSLNSDTSQTSVDPDQLYAARLRTTILDLELQLQAQQIPQTNAYIPIRNSKAKGRAEGKRKVVDSGNESALLSENVLLAIKGKYCLPK